MRALEYQFPAEPAMLREIRGKLRSALEGKGLASQAVSRILLALDELVSNAIEHGQPYRAAGKPLRLQVSILEGDLCLDFFDLDVPDDRVLELAKLLAASAGKPPDLKAERGRGLFLIDDAFDEVSIEVGRGGGMHLRGRVLKVLD